MELEQHVAGDYRVNLEVFEGPLDLLLHLIKKNDLDIYDIPIAFLLETYMGHLENLRDLNIDMAGEFLLMAAELAHIKSRMLLPVDDATEEEEEPDPRADLVRRLLEYQQYRDAALNLDKRPQLWRDVFVPQAPERIVDEGEGPIEANVYDLIEAFGHLLKRLPAEQYHEVAVDRLSVNARILQLVDLLKADTTTVLTDLLIPPVARYDMVVTFLSLLEMCRLKMIRVYQAERYGSLYVQRTMSEVREEDLLHLVQQEEGGSHGT